MLLERIDIDSRGMLSGVQLGPFSPRLNVVFGAPGSGKTATIDFIRSVMLGADRHWHASLSGHVVWSNREGLLDCRRELDGTPHGRLMVDFLARDGRSYDRHYGYRTPEQYDRLDQLVDIPRRSLDALVAPSKEISVQSVYEACRAAGLDTSNWTRDEEEIRRVQQAISELDRQLTGYKRQLAEHDSLLARRRELVDQLAHFDRMERQTPASDQHRSVLETRLADSRDEVTRLRRQEADLRQSLADLERERTDLTSLNDSDQRTPSIAHACRNQLAALDSQLVRLCRALREIRSLRDHWTRPLDGRRLPLHGDATGEFVGSSRGWEYNSYRTRLDAARRHLDWLLRYHNEIPSEDDLRYATTRYPASLDDEYVTSQRIPRATQWDYLDRSDVDAVLNTTRDLIASLDRFDSLAADGRYYEVDLSASESTLADTIDRLVIARTSLLERIAREYNLSLSHLLNAFGDWSRCHDQPHLYQWLLSEHFPPRVEDQAVRSARLRRLDAEYRELMDELNRTANRLDDSVRESRTWQQRLAAQPVYLPVVVDGRRRNWLRDELSEVERQLRWLENHRSIEEQRRQLGRRLDTLVAGSQRPSAFLDRATYWLNQLSDGHLTHLVNNRHWAISEGSASGPVVGATHVAGERETMALALRMAAAEQLRENGTQLPLLVDEPYSNWLGESGKSRLADVFARFANHGHQLIVFTAHRGLAENIRALGGHGLAMTPGRYYQARYRESWSEPPTNINRELDTAWRETYGLYDDPHWYRPTDSYGIRDRYDYEPQPRSSESRDYPSQFAYDADIELPSRAARGPASPFFLTEASPVDQAPSVDAVAAERLRVQGITTVGQLLNADPKRVASNLQLADVTPQVVVRWQDEATLVCGVPQLRNFDARVLVGCGYTDPSQLARMHPGHLLEKVEAFLATDRGRQILRTGSSYELSRITSWIAAANRSVARSQRHGSRTSRSSRSNRQEYDRRSREHSTGEYREQARRQRKLELKRKRREARERMPQSSNRSFAQLAEREARVAATDTTSELRFYLEMESPIVDAPSIGPKTAARMEAIGYRTVRQFLLADASVISQALNHRRLTPELLETWQKQSRLMCQVPMLRGHDVQMLIASGIETPQALATESAERLLTKVDRIARSAEGKRILRGSSRPDLEEVKNWIEWARSSRRLKAA